jgi:hypothetical protein
LVMVNGKPCHVLVMIYEYHPCRPRWDNKMTPERKTAISPNRNNCIWHFGDGILTAILRVGEYILTAVEGGV